MVTDGLSLQAKIRRWIEVGLLCLIALALVFCAADWLAWKLRGSPQGSVVVTRLVVAPLKGNREEYYPDGTETLPCSQSILPWDATQACWWMERHRVVFDR